MRKYTVIGIVALVIMAGTVLGVLILKNRKEKASIPPFTNVQNPSVDASGESSDQNEQSAQNEAAQHEFGRNHGGNQDLASRLQVARESLAKQRYGEDGVPARGAAPIVKPVLNEQPKLSLVEFLAALHEAVGKADPNEIRAVLEKVPQDPKCIESLKAMMGKPGVDQAMQRYAAEALVRIGTRESVQFVLDQILAAYNAGETDKANSLMASLEAPTTITGVRALFDCLLGLGDYAQAQEALPAEVVSSVRKSLLAAPEREAVGKLAAELYLDPKVMRNKDAMWELFDGVSHPVMLAQLASRAYQEHLPKNAAAFMDRLGQLGDQGAVEAIVKMVPSQTVPLDDAAMALYDWSILHPREALPGLFLEYLTDSARPPEQRSVAAFGLAGTTNWVFAREALEKALTSEHNPIVRTNLQTALTVLNQEQAK